MTSPPDSMKDPLLDCRYHGLLRFASLPPSKRAYSVHSEFFDESNPLALKAYVNCPHPSVGAGFFISLCLKDLGRRSPESWGIDPTARFRPRDIHSKLIKYARISCSSLTVSTSLRFSGMSDFAMTLTSSRSLFENE
jgi:hypothetical protein